MVESLEQAIAELERLPVEDQEQIGRSLLCHVVKLRALRAEIDNGIASLDADRGKNPASLIFSGTRIGRWPGRPHRDWWASRPKYDVITDE